MPAPAPVPAAAPTKLRYCSQPVPKPRVVPAGVESGRASAIIAFSKKWVAGTDLTYYCYRPGDGSGPAWHGKPSDIAAVSKAFAHWAALGVGISFREVPEAAQAMVRIGFDQGDGSWSYVGRDTLGIAAGERTMNFGWALTDAYGFDTALHEIGHALGLEHEHKNPFAGIVWDEPAVRAYFRGAPNNWSDAQIDRNIIDKIEQASVKGTDWDPDSVMEYEFGPGLIRKPEPYLATGLKPKGGLSPFDIKWMRESYPQPVAGTPQLQLSVLHPLQLADGQTGVFEFRPSETRSYRIETIGSSDTVLVLFELTASGKLQLGADDDGGEDRNAAITRELKPGSVYQVGVRMFHADPGVPAALKIV